MKAKLAILFILSMGLSPVHADDGSGFAIYQAQMNEIKTATEASTVKNICGESHISFDGNQSATDDEFLYDTKTAYDSVKNRKDGGTVNGTVYECDNAHCTNNKVQLMGPGHVYKGQVINNAVEYRCRTGIADRWVPLQVGCMYRGTSIAENQWYSQNGQRVTLTYNECLQFDMNTNKGENAFYAKCENVSGTLQLRCYSAGGGKINDPAQPVVPTPSPTQNCISSRTSAEGKACCLVPSSVAKWDGSKCVCTDPSKTFINVSCVSQQQNTTVTFSCSQADLVQLYAWLEQYASNPQIVALINQILEFCTNDDNRSQIEFNRMMAELRALIAQTQVTIAQTECRRIPGTDWVGGKCVCVAAGKVLNEAGTACVDSAETVAANLNAALQRSRNEISSASSKINAIKESFKKTVWKDEDGKFNTSRLASDSIAAVVLGTAGGLITSNVIKKNQVKNGFEDINCTVGGQKVAAWGDEFRVGIQ